MRTRLIFGAMTGTSIDGIDTAAIRVCGRGLRMRFTLLGQSTAPLGDLTVRLRSAHRQEPLTAGAFTALARDLAIAHLSPLRTLADAHGEPDLIALHGQTLFHQPPLSLQLIDASIVAHAFGCAVMSNLRGCDLAAGGQGAPITPLSDWMTFRARRSWRVVVNLGGFSNATIIPPAPECADSKQKDASWLNLVRGFDLCLCNQLLDHIARTKAGIPFDEDGRLAAVGHVRAPLLIALRTLLDRQRQAGRSLGTADEIIAAAASTVADSTAADALATASRAISETIAAGIRHGLAAKRSNEKMQVLIAGGGARNHALLRELALAVGSPIHPTSDFGVPIEARETMAMAILGTLAADGVAITLPAVTGRGDTRVADGALVRQRVDGFTKHSHAMGLRPPQRAS